jgi:tetratricopeptide (TPR) repeat protein
LHERRDPQAQIFGHSLLCFRSWLSMHKEKVYNHCQELFQYKINETIHPSISGRYFASQLFQAEVYDYDLEPILLAAREFYLDTKYSKTVSQGFPYYEFILSESLILTQQYEEALFYIIEATKKRNNYAPPYVDLKLFESIYLFHAIALKNIGKAEKAKEMLEMINVKNFYFLAKKFNLILYLLQKQSFHKRDLLRGQLEYLIRQTGFKKLVAGYPEIVIMPE